MNSFTKLSPNKFVTVEATPIANANVIDIAFNVPFQNVPLEISVTSSDNKTFLLRGMYSSGESVILPYSSSWSTLEVKLLRKVSHLSISILFNTVLNNYRTDALAGGEYV